MGVATAPERHQTGKRHAAALTGNEAVATAMRQVNPDVVAAYPITPQTDIVMNFATFVADGLVNTEFVQVESEHSAMSATVGAAAAGARAMTATASNGLAFMWEILYIASGSRLPIVMPVGNRALSGPINIHCDHSDAMGARDSGWLQLYSENAQEAYDNVIQAVRIAEHPDVLLPAMVNLDGFIITHGMENVELLPDEAVDGFVGEYSPRYPLLDVDRPVTVGSFALQDSYFEFKRQQAEAMIRAKEVVVEVGQEFGALSGRQYGLFDEYRLEDAELGVLVLGSTAGSVRYVVDGLRKKGQKVGLLKLRAFRPFPYDELKDALSGLRALAVMDRSDSFSTVGGPVFAEARAALYDAPERPLAVNYIYGLGGRDISLDMIESVYRDLEGVAAKGAVDQYVRYLGVRE
ncbi:MAG: pyruvate ferredoxin oxidoreductase [Firmicutes bacterium]|nr:pyruvate ferredoxin oxidoreductase [Bacillota bacterium]